MTADISWPLPVVSQTLWYASASDADRHEASGDGGVHLLYAAPGAGFRGLVGFGSSVAVQPQQTLWCEFLPPVLCWNGWPADTLDDLLAVALVEVRVRDVQARNPGQSVINACATIATVDVLRTLPMADLTAVEAAPAALDWSRRSGLAGVLYARPDIVRLGPYVLATGTTEADQGNVAVFHDGRDGVDLLLTSSHDDASVVAGRTPMPLCVEPDGRTSRWPAEWRVPPLRASS